MSTLQLSNIVKAYGIHTIMDGVSLSFQDGEFVILVGPSGCGKSTLLRMIAGLEPITDGEIAIGSRVVNDMPPKDRNIAMVFQSYALYPHKTVAQNMAFALKLKKVPAREIESKVKAAAEILDLSHLLERYPKQLSGGQRQRVAMGRAIVREPEIFLFDEPLSNLDAKLRVQMRAEIKNLHRRLKSTIVYVTHDQMEAMTMADKIVVMNAGRVEQFGAPLELYDRPANLFVAGFIGSPAMNFLDGMVEAEADRFFFRTKGGSRFALPTDMARLALGRPAIAGIRPEHIVHGTGDGCLNAEVIIDEPTGSETHVALRAGHDEFLAVFHERMSIAPSQPMNILFPPERIHLFDRETGQHIG
jgi:multiple sugar transport system ATP-binding protein